MKQSPGRQKGVGANTRRDIDLARKSYQHRAWADAYQAFLRADQKAPLAAEDLELLAMEAYLVGRERITSRRSSAPTMCTEILASVFVPLVARSGSAFVC
jgi:hypothetical protein